METIGKSLLALLGGFDLLFPLGAQDCYFYSIIMYVSPTQLSTTNHLPIIQRKKFFNVWQVWQNTKVKLINQLIQHIWPCKAMLLSKKGLTNLLRHWEVKCQLEDLNVFFSPINSLMSRFSAKIQFVGVLL